VRRRDNGGNYAGHCERRNILRPWENFLPPRFFHLCADHGFCIPFIERCIHNGAYIAVLYLPYAAACDPASTRSPRLYTFCKSFLIIVCENVAIRRVISERKGSASL